MHNYLNVKINHQTEKSAKQFLMSIFDEIKEQTIDEVSKSPFLTVLADGSIDCSVVEQYVMLVRFVNSKGFSVTIIASIQAVESAYAVGILKTIKEGLTALKLDLNKERKPTVVGANCQDSPQVLSVEPEEEKTTSGDS